MGFANNGIDLTFTLIVVSCGTHLVPPFFTNKLLLGEGGGEGVGTLSF